MNSLKETRKKSAGSSDSPGQGGAWRVDLGGRLPVLHEENLLPPVFLGERQDLVLSDAQEPAKEGSLPLPPERIQRLERPGERFLEDILDLDSGAKVGPDAQAKVAVQGVAMPPDEFIFRLRLPGPRRGDQFFGGSHRTHDGVHVLQYSAGGGEMCREIPEKFSPAPGLRFQRVTTSSGHCHRLTASAPKPARPDRDSIPDPPPGGP